MVPDPDVIRTRLAARSVTVALEQINDIFLKLLAGTESKALRYSFFAEREAAKVADVPADTTLREIKSAAINGAGTMGGGISMCFLGAGIPVVMIDTKQEAVDRGLATIKKNFAATVEKGRLSQAEMDKRMALLSTATDLSAAAKADIIVEAVFETIRDDQFRLLFSPGAVFQRKSGSCC